MRKQPIGLALSAMFFALCTSVQAQQGDIPRIGYLTSTSFSAEASRIDVLRYALRDLGYLEGKNIVIEYRFAEGVFDRLTNLAAELVRMKTDVIVTTGSPATQAAHRATRTILIVMNLVGDPVPRFVASLAKPGGNITGLTQIAPQLSGKRLELLQEVLPKISRVTVFDDGALTGEQISGNLRETEIAAEVLGIKIQVLELGGRNPDLEGAFKTATSQRCGCPGYLTRPSFAATWKACCGAGGKEPASGDVPIESVRRSRRAHVLCGGC